MHILPNKKLNFICLVALANRNAQAGVNPTLALIETTAHPKRCGFGLSIQKFGSLEPDPDKLGPLWVPSLLDFLNAGDEFRRFFSMLFRDSGRGEGQNNYDFLGG